MNDDLVQRLRGEYTTPINDGAGLLDGKDTFTRTFQTSPIMHEASDMIVALRDALNVYKEWRKTDELKLASVHELIDGYLDGAPDASPASKLANQINQIIHPI